MDIIVPSGPEQAAYVDVKAAETRINNLFIALENIPIPTKELVEEFKEALAAPIQQLISAAKQPSICPVSPESYQLLLTGNEAIDEQAKALAGQNQMLQTQVDTKQQLLIAAEETQQQLSTDLELVREERDQAQQLLAGATDNETVKQLQQQIEGSSTRTFQLSQLVADEKAKYTQALNQHEKQMLEAQRQYNEELAKLRSEKQQLLTSKEDFEKQAIQEAEALRDQLRQTGEQLEEQRAITQSETLRITQQANDAVQQTAQNYQEAVTSLENEKQQLTAQVSSTQLLLESGVQDKNLILADREAAVKENQLLDAKIKELRDRIAVLESGSETAVNQQLTIQSDEIDKLREQVATCESNTNTLLARITTAGQELTRLRNEKETLDANNRTLLEREQTLNTNILVEKQRLITFQTEAVATNLLLGDKTAEISRLTSQLNQARTSLNTANLTLTERNNEIASLRQEIRSLENEVSLLNTRLLEQAQEVEQFMVVEPSKVNTVLAIESKVKELDVASTTITRLQNELAQCRLREASKIPTTATTTTIPTILPPLICPSIDTGAQKAIAAIDMYTWDTFLDKINGPTKLFNPALHKEILVFASTQRDKLTTVLEAYRKLRNLTVFRQNAIPPFPRLFAIDKEWQGDYVLLTRKDLNELRQVYIGEQPKKEQDVIMGMLRGAVSTLTHMDAVNQVAWQAQVSQVKEQGGAYTVEVWFSRGKPSLALSKELRFVASNVHIIQDPNNNSGDLYYAIDLAKPESLSNIEYTELGTLVRNAIYGHASVSYRIVDNATGEEVESQRIENYSFPEDNTREYNTKVMLTPSEDVIFYARDTKNDTYILETILIRA